MQYSFASIVAELIKIINQVIPVLGALALVLFMVGVVRYIRSGNEKKNRDEIMWSLVALFVLFSIWGILRILTNTFVTPSGANSTGVNGYFGTSNYQNTQPFGGPR